MAIAESAFRGLGYLGVKYRRANSKIPQNDNWLPQPIGIQTLQAEKAQNRALKLLEIAKQFETANEAVSFDQKLERFETIMDTLMHPEALQTIEHVMQRIGDGTFYLIPVGSAALGGMLIRDYSGTMHTFPKSKQDIDLMLVFERSIPETSLDFYAINKNIQNTMENISTQSNLQSFTTCQGQESRAATVTNLNQPSLPTIEEILQWPSVTTGDVIAHIFSTFFYKSVPDYKNKEARRIILQAMEKFSVEENNIWNDLVRLIPYHVFKRRDLVKSRYFTPDEELMSLSTEEVQRYEKHRQRLNSLLQELASNILKDLLDSTGKR